MTGSRSWLVACTLMGLMLSGVSAQAQWVMVARAVSGRIQRMSNNAPNGSGYDVATVVLEANADKVYQAALTNLSTHADLTITRKDAKSRILEFAKGDQVAGLQATPLGEKITQLVIASNLTGAQPSPTSIVVDGVMRVCKEMKVTCTLAGSQ